MTKWELRFYPDHVLEEISSSVGRYDEDLRRFADRMCVFMSEHGGVGLAAPQIGILSRIVTVDVKGVEKCLVNPEVVSSSDEGDTDTEGCLSIPDRWFCVKRSLKIEVKAKSPSGKRLHFEAEDFAARVLQHEIDHLNGVLICHHGTGMEQENSYHP
ncbi:peptide deformylase [bacterium]|nr:peptide deformylase [bacterium]